MVKLQYFKKRYNISVPASLVKRMGWKKGIDLVWSREGNKLFLEAVEQPNETTEGDKD